MTDWEGSEARAIYEVEGRIELATEDPESIGFNQDTTNVSFCGSELEQVEELGANIVNIDGWFNPVKFYEAPQILDMGDGAKFIPDYGTVELRFDVPRGELIDAAKQRAAEDETHIAYVLGDWAYRAENCGHVESSKPFSRAFGWAKLNIEDWPEDATTEEAGGGRR